MYDFSDHLIETDADVGNDVS